MLRALSSCLGQCQSGPFGIVVVAAVITGILLRERQPAQDDIPGWSRETVSGGDSPSTNL